MYFSHYVKRMSRKKANKLKTQRIKKIFGVAYALFFSIICKFNFLH